MKQLTRFVLALAFVVMAPLPAMSAEPTVSRAQFTSSILDREPTDELSAIGPGAETFNTEKYRSPRKATAIAHQASAR